MTSLSYEVQGHVLLLTLNRPEVRNAWNPEMCLALHAAWKRFIEDDQLRVCVVSGNGKMFTAGLDLKNPPKDQAPLAMPNLSVPCDKPILVAVEGAAIGYGSVFCMLADMVFAGNTAYFLYPEAKLGLFQGLMGGFAGRIQYKAGLQWLMTGEPMSAPRAREVGLVNEVVEDGQALARAMEVAGFIAGNAPLVIQAMKALALGTVPKGPMETNFRVHQLITRNLESEDGREGLAAFRDHRKADFKGR